MKNIIFILSLMAISLGFISCTESDDPVTPQGVEIPLSGKYAWSFEIPQHGNQRSEHDFNNDFIVYTMTGDVYNVQYNMEVLSYDANKKRIVAVGAEASPKAGVYFVIFLKDTTPQSVNMYKAEKPTKEEAESMEVPAADNTEFHGWNVYQKVNTP